MSNEATLFIQDSDTLDYTTSSAMTAGEVFQWNDGRAAVIKETLASGELGAVYMRGLFKFASASATTFSAGDPVYWDYSGNLAITAAGATEDFYLGPAVEAKINGQTTVLVDLNAVVPSVITYPFITSDTETIAHDNTAEHEVLAAAANTGGYYVYSLNAIVKEAMVGSSEDQLIVTLYDSDDTALATLTASDGAADGIGDLIMGTPTFTNATTGNVAAVVAAGKGAYLKVSQATVGGSIAGIFDCKVVFLAV